MDTVTKRLYEAMFLIDTATAAADWDEINTSIERVLTRNGGEIVSINKWDERKLAYEVGRVDRGTYILAYFNGDPAQIGAIERDVQLSEQIMRVMILRTDVMSKEDLEKETPVAMVKRKAAEQAAAAEKAAAEKAEAEKAAAEQAEEKSVVTETEEEALVEIEAPEELSQESDEEEKEADLTD